MWNPTPDKVTETEEAAQTSFPGEISREHVVAISSPRLCLLRVGRCRSKRRFYWTGKVDRRRICSHHLSDGDTQVSIVMLSWIIFNSFPPLDKMNGFICRCCTPNTPTTDATWRWMLINSEEWMFDGTTLSMAGVLRRTAAEASLSFIQMTLWPTLLLVLVLSYQRLENNH